MKQICSCLYLTSLLPDSRQFKQVRVAIFGFTFKEDCPDTRNIKVIDIYRELGEYDIVPMVVDPVADAEEVKKLFGITFQEINDIRDMDAVIIALAHEVFLGYDKNIFILFMHRHIGVKF